MHIRRDKLGRSYTPPALAVALLRRAADLGWSPEIVCDPCAGGGAFLDAARAIWPGCGTVGIDLDPDAPYDADVRQLGDARTVARLVLADLEVTNPPFGTAVGAQVTIEIVERMRLAPLAIAVLPVDYVTQVGWRKAMAQASQVWPLVGRPWSHERGMVTVVWDQAHRGPTTWTPLASPSGRWDR